MIDNRLGIDHCDYCHDTGQVVVSVERRPVFEYRNKQGKRVPSASQAATQKQTGEAAYENFGPCQACTKGAWMEFPGPDKNGKPQVGHWGEEGFWRGRKMETLADQSRPLSLEENRRRWREMGLATGLLARTVDG